jgi:hypothetical protein
MSKLFNFCKALKRFKSFFLKLNHSEKGSFITYLEARMQKVLLQALETFRLTFNFHFNYKLVKTSTSFREVLPFLNNCEQEKEIFSFSNKCKLPYIYRPLRESFV